MDYESSTLNESTASARDGGGGVPLSESRLSLQEIASLKEEHCARKRRLLGGSALKGGRNSRHRRFTGVGSRIRAPSADSSCQSLASHSIPVPASRLMAALNKASTAHVTAATSTGDLAPSNDGQRLNNSANNNNNSLPPSPFDQMALQQQLLQQLIQQQLAQFYYNNFSAYLQPQVQPPQFVQPPFGAGLDQRPSSAFHSRRRRKEEAANEPPNDLSEELPPFTHGFVSPEGDQARDLEGKLLAPPCRRDPRAVLKYHAPSPIRHVPSTTSVIQPPLPPPQFPFLLAPPPLAPPAYWQPPPTATGSLSAAGTNLQLESLIRARADLIELVTGVDSGPEHALEDEDPNQIVISDFEFNFN